MERMGIMNTGSYKIDDYLKEVASKAPIPGGGGASAVAGALSAALSSMVCNLTVGKKSYMAVEDDIKKILESMNSHIDSFLKLADKDAEVFYPLSQAYGFKPKDEKEKSEHEKNMEKDGEVISLTPKEYAIFEYLCLNKGRLVSAGELLEHNIDMNGNDASNVIKVHIAAIRRKLGSDAIKTNRGMGYTVAG